MSQEKLKLSDMIILAYLAGAFVHTFGNVLYFGVNGFSLNAIFNIIYSFIIWPLPAFLFIFYFLFLFSEANLFVLICLFISSYLAFIIAILYFIRLKNRND